MRSARKKLTPQTGGVKGKAQSKRRYEYLGHGVI